jgi:hypothetical protein
MKMTAFWDNASCSLLQADRRSEVRTATIIRPMMWAVRTSETSVYFHESAQSNITESCHLHIRCRQNLKAQICKNAFQYISDTRNYMTWYSSWWYWSGFEYNWRLSRVLLAVVDQSAQMRFADTMQPERALYRSRETEASATELRCCKFTCSLCCIVNFAFTGNHCSTMQNLAPLYVPRVFCFLPTRSPSIQTTVGFMCGAR